MPDEMLDQIAESVDVREMKLDLEPAQKLRTIALMMGIRYYTDTIIKDPQYLQLMMQKEKEAAYSNNPQERELWHLRPANVLGVLNCAEAFEAFLLGKPSNIASIKYGEEEVLPRDGGAQTEI